MNEQYREAMGKALFLANRARETGDVPVGAVVVDEDGRIIGRGWNCREANHDPAGHAEIVALREAGRVRGTWRLTGCTLIVTLEPCTMCAGAILASRIDRVVFGAWDPKAGAAGSLRDVLRDARIPHPTEVVGGVLAQEAAMQLRSFFLGCRTPDEMPVIQAPVHEPGDIVAPIVVPYEENEAPEPIREETPREETPHEETPHEEAPRHEGVPAQLVTPEAPAAPAAPAPSDEDPRSGAFPVPPRHGRVSHRGTEASPLPRRVGRPFSERVSGNADNPADIPAGESIEPGASAAAPVSQPPYSSAAPVLPAVSPSTTRGPITRSVPQIRPVHVRPSASVPEGLYTPAQPGRPVAQPLRDSAPRPRVVESASAPAPTEPPAPVVQAAPAPAVQAAPAPVEEPPAPIPAPPAFPQRATSRQSARPQRPLPQAFEPEPARRVDYELSPRQFNDVDPITSGIRVRRSARRRGNARH